MSDELKPCPFCGVGGAKAGAHKADCYFSLCAELRDGPKGDLTLVPDILAAWNRRTAPVSAPLDTQALPPLPDGDEYSATRMLANGELAPRFTAATMQQYARAHAAPYAERIAHLERALRSANLLLAETFISTGKAMSSRAKAISDEIECALAGAHLERELDQARGAYQGCATALEIANREAGKEAILQHLADQGQDIERELAERKPASIDSPEFQSKVGTWAGAAMSDDKYTSEVGAKEAWAALIAYIDGRTTGTAPSRRDIFAICDAYESGVGHGLQRDGHKSGVIFGDPKHGMAYEIGYTEGEERATKEA